MAIVLSVYSITIHLFVTPLFRLAATFHHRASFQWQGRKRGADIARDLTNSLAQQTERPRIIFFCSSAGEYEQAKPLIDALARDGFVPLIFFFSRSGFEFASARNEMQFFTLTPPDTLGDWREILEAANPVLTIVVRHELWPAFLYTAKRFAPIWAINVTTTNTQLFAKIRARLLFVCERIYTIDLPTKNELATLGIREAKLFAIGDTKFDRALQRVGEGATPSGPRPVKTVILGSIYLEDLHLITESWQATKKLRRDWRLIAVPHDISDGNVQAICQQLTKVGARTVLYSQEPNALSKLETFSPDQIVVVDTIGLLAELYANGSIAYIGGAIHNKVHNVLEPAAYDLDIAVGPRFQTSPEAVAMVEREVISVVDTAAEFVRWWSREPRSSRRPLELLRALAGSAAAITNDICQEFGSSVIKPEDAQKDETRA